MSVFNIPAPAENEDCLYLNVFAPTSKPPSGGFAVMFWLYGGAFQFGSSSMPVYDATSFAANQDIVVVTPNYRTNGKKLCDALPLVHADERMQFLDFLAMWKGCLSNPRISAS